MAPPSTPDKYPLPEAFDEIVTINVGVKKEEKDDSTNEFKVHKGVLCFYSGYFEACFKGGFAEARRGAVNLTDERPVTIKHFIAWLYTRHLPIDHESEASDRQWENIIHLWIFADKRQVPLLANRCINAIRELVVVRWRVPTAELHFIYENTTKDSPLRRFIIHIIAHLVPFSQVKDEMRQRYPNEALWDILSIVSTNGGKRMGPAEVLAIDVCKYHRHEKSARCPYESTAHIRSKTKS